MDEWERSKGTEPCHSPCSSVSVCWVSEQRAAFETGAQDTECSLYTPVSWSVNRAVTLFCKIMLWCLHAHYLLIYMQIMTVVVSVSDWQYPPCGKPQPWKKGTGEVTVLLISCLGSVWVCQVGTQQRQHLWTWWHTFTMWISWREINKEIIKEKKYTGG